YDRKGGGGTGEPGGRARGLKVMRSRRTRAMVLRQVPRRRCAPNAFVFGRSIRLAATVRPAMTRAALLGGACLAALAMLVPHAGRAQEGPFTYVPNSSDGTVSVIDTPTNAVAPTAISVGLSPVAAAGRGDESLVYVSKAGGG